MVFIREDTVDLTNRANAISDIEHPIILFAQFVHSRVFESSDVVVIVLVRELGIELSLGMGKQQRAPCHDRHLKAAVAYELKLCFRRQQPKVHVDADFAQVFLVYSQERLIGLGCVDDLDVERLPVFH